MSLRPGVISNRVSKLNGRVLSSDRPKYRPADLSADMCFLRVSVLADLK